MLSKDYENMAVKGISVTIPGWLSSMTTDHRNGPDMLEGFKPLEWKGKRVGGG